MTEPDLLAAYDALLLDLDGTVYRGGEAVPGAVEAIKASRDRGAGIRYVTNNASRKPGSVAEHLNELGFQASVEEVSTSSQAAAAVLAERLDRGALVLIIGTPALTDEVEAVGLTSTRVFSPRSPPSCRGIPPTPAGATSPRRPWPSAMARSGWRATSTRRCRPSGACCRATAPW